MYFFHLLPVCLGVNFNHEGSLPQSPAFLLLRWHDLPRLHLLWVDCVGTIPRKGNSVTGVCMLGGWKFQKLLCDSTVAVLNLEAVGKSLEPPRLFFPDFAYICSCLIWS